MSRGRPPTTNVRLHVRIPADLMEKLYLLRPELMHPFDPGKPRYGGPSRYIEMLIRKDLEHIEKGIPPR